jgi:hypothetical protein
MTVQSHANAHPSGRPPAAMFPLFAVPAADYLQSRAMVEVAIGIDDKAAT